MTDPVPETAERAQPAVPAQPPNNSPAPPLLSDAAACVGGQLNPRTVTGLQRAAGNRAVGRLLARTAQPRARVLARDATAAVTSPPPTLTVADTWAQAQSDWTTIVAARDAMEAAGFGTTVTLGGEQSVDLVASADTLAAVRRATRHRLMEMMYLIWNSYRGTDLAGARADPDPASAMVALQAKVLAQVRPIYDALQAGKPDDERFEYKYTDETAPQWTQSVRDAVAEVAGLIAQASAEGARADPEAAHRAAKQIVGDADWCGAFAYNQFRNAGVDLPTTALGQNPLAWTGPWSLGVGIDGFFQYLPALLIKVGPDTWKDVRAYHEERGSLRRFQVLPASGAAFDSDTRKYEKSDRRGGMVDSLDALDIQPGDLVMIDRAKGTFGDHIAMCRAYDSSTHHLWTIGGNEGAAHPVNVSGMWDLDSNPAPVSVAGDAKHARVYAVARFSAVDFETHMYRLKK